jgi:hypothetical protein
MNNETTYNSCPICSARIKEWRTKTVNAEKYKIDLCKNCYYAFINPRPSLDFLMDYYSTSGHGAVVDNITDMCTQTQNLLTMEASAPNSTLDAHRIIKAIKYYSISDEKNFLMSDVDMVSFQMKL